MKRYQQGHFEFTFLYWLVAAAGAVLTGSGGLLLWWAARALLR